MTIAEFREILQGALEIAYGARDKAQGKDARIDDVIILLTLLEGGVQKLLEKKQLTSGNG